MIGWTRYSARAGAFLAVVTTSLHGQAADDAVAEAEAAESVEATTPDPELLDPGGLGLFLWFGGGIGEGDDAAPAYRVHGPKGLVSLRFEIAYSYIYTGMGLTGIYFEDHAPINQEVVFATTGGDAGSRSGSADGTAFDAELGAAHSLVFAERGWALRPALGLGWQTSPEVTRIVQDCRGCDSDKVLDAYVGGPFARAQLGVHMRLPTALGLNVMYQQFLGEVSEPALNWTLLAGIVYGVDGQ
jgi:hypothetical protein